ncbi:MAG: hypothetical protein G5Z42_04120 [Caldisphaeraceae archaeon]|nr:hypothetical protein [Caldisphaeraceae archaeon]MEB3691603.1 hypothetical protein [Caldisphaeraceae archaeon]MEB3797992.1 hypothetical protein [Caldisphaeraceae archaeon]
MRRSRSELRKKVRFNDLVVQRMERLFSISKEKVKEGDIEYSRQINELILRLSLRNKIKIPRTIKRSICKNCHVALVPGLTCTIRLRSQGKMSYLVIRCKECGWIRRIPYNKVK